MRGGEFSQLPLLVEEGRDAMQHIADGVV